MELKQIEADVVIVFKNEIQDHGMVVPFWECEETTENLIEHAEIMALQFSEKIGGGATEYTIHDFR